MASEAARRAAGASGAGSSAVGEDEVIGGQGESAKPKRRERSAKNQPEEQARILSPDVLTFKILRGEKERATLVIPTVLTIGDVLQKRALQDVDAYCQLLLIEVARLSNVNLAGNPALLFSPENQAYFAVALLRANVRDLLFQVLTKTAHIDMVVDGEPVKNRLVEDDFDQLEDGEIIQIGAHYYGRWIERMAQAREKKRMRAELA